MRRARHPPVRRAIGRLRRSQLDAPLLRGTTPGPPVVQAVEASAMKADVELPDVIVLFVVRSSQFCVKAAAYMLDKGIPFRYQYLADPGVLAPPATVPVLRWGDKLIPDSQKILEFLHQFVEGAPIYPTEEAKELDSFLGSEFNQHVQYMSWIDDEGFESSMKGEVESAVPAVFRVLCPCCCAPRALLRNLGYEKKIMDKIVKYLPEETLAGGSAAVRESLRNHLKELNARLERSNGFLLGTSEPTGADYGLFGMLSRLIGDSGSGLGPAYPGLVQEAQCEKIEEFFSMMNERCGGVRFTDDLGIPKGETFLPRSVDEQIAMRLPAGEVGAMEA